MSKQNEKIDYLTLMGYVDRLKIQVYDLSQIDCKFDFDDEVGRGGAMIVYSGRLRAQPEEGITVALKVPNADIRQKTPNEKIYEVLANVRQELRMMKHLEEHPNIIDLYGVTFKDLRPIVIVELAVDSLTSYLAGKKDDEDPVDWATKSRFCCEVADGVRALHAVKIVHGDLKCDNILLFVDPEDENELICKISDFGYSATEATIKHGGGTGGTTKFTAPECTPSADTEIKPFANYSTKDNYSYGLFVWQVAKDGEAPFEGFDADEIDRIKNTDQELTELIVELAIDTPNEFRAVIVSMTKYVPKDRASLRDVRKMIGLDEVNDSR